MKTILLSFIVTVFLFANGHSKDLSGTKLKCTLATMEKYLEFISNNEVIEYDFMPSQIKYWIWNNFYKVNIKYIEFSWMKNFEHKNPSELNRETLKYGSYDCKKIPDDYKFNIKAYLDEQIIKLEEAQKKKNKI